MGGTGSRGPARETMKVLACLWPRANGATAARRAPRVRRRYPENRILASAHWPRRGSPVAKMHRSCDRHRGVPGRPPAAPVRRTAPCGPAADAPAAGHRSRRYAARIRRRGYAGAAPPRPWPRRRSARSRARPPVLRGARRPAAPAASASRHCRSPPNRPSPAAMRRPARPRSTARAARPNTSPAHCPHACAAPAGRPADGARRRAVGRTHRRSPRAASCPGRAAAARCTAAPARRACCRRWCSEWRRPGPGWTRPHVCGHRPAPRARRRARRRCPRRRCPARARAPASPAGAPGTPPSRGCSPATRPVRPAPPDAGTARAGRGRSSASARSTARPARRARAAPRPGWPLRE